jgi:excisionase family DNA binding protein
MPDAEDLLDSFADAIARRVIAHLDERAPSPAPPPSPPQPEYLTTRGAAKVLALGTSTLEGWRSRGDGPAFVKIGTAIRYSRADLDAWLAKHARKGKAK